MASGIVEQSKDSGKASRALTSTSSDIIIYIRRVNRPFPENTTQVDPFCTYACQYDSEVQDLQEYPRESHVEQRRERVRSLAG